MGELSRPALPPTRPLVSGFLKEFLGDEASARAYYDDSERNVVAIVEAEGVPSESLATYTTASLHAAPNVLEEKDIRVELLMVGPRAQEAIGNVVATAAFCVLKDGWLAAPGVVFADAVSEYVRDATTPHVMWVEPFDFEDVRTVRIDGLDDEVHLLQALPLTEDERRFLLQFGYDALTERLGAAEVAHYDLYRPSTC